MRALQGCASTWSMPRPHMTSPHRKSRIDFRLPAGKYLPSGLKYRSGLCVSLRSTERRSHLGQHLCLVCRVTRREVKWLDAPHIGFSRDLSSRRGCQMRPLACQCCVRPRKCRLNEEDVGILNERHDGCTIGRRVGDIGNIADLLARSDGQDITQAAKWNEVSRRRRLIDMDQMIVRATLDNGVLERAQPRANGEPALQEPVLPDVDMRRLLQRKGKAGHAVVKDRG